MIEQDYGFLDDHNLLYTLLMKIEFSLYEGTWSNGDGWFLNYIKEQNNAGNQYINIIKTKLYDGTCIKNDFAFLKDYILGSTRV